MKNKRPYIHVLMILIAFLPVAYLAIIWNSVPKTVALHFNYKMQPDRLGPRQELFTLAIVLATTSVLLYFLLRNIHRIDPKRNKAPYSPVFRKLGFGLLLFFTALNFLILYTASQQTNAMISMLFPLLGLLFAFIGNYMNNIKPNYFAGFRLPWTLSDDNNWRATHHLASKLWFWGGLALAIICLFLPFKIVLPFFITTVAIMSLVPAIYSYTLFKKQNAN